MYLNEKEISEITKGFEKRLRHASQKAPDSSGDMASIQSWMRRNNVETPETLNIAVKKIGNGVQSGKKRCPECHSPLKYQGNRKRKLYTGKLGSLEITRAYYTCSQKGCKYTDYPLERYLGLSKQKVCGLLEEQICFLCAQMPFDHVCEYLARSEGISVSQNMVLKTAQANGVEYRENKLSVLFDQKDINKDAKGNSKINKKRFVSSLAKGVEHFEQLLEKKAFEMGSYKAQEIIFLSDGAEWIDRMRQRIFPKSIHILDWYHACEHLYTCARKIFGETAHKKIEAWVTPLKEMLYEGRAAELCDRLLFEARKYDKHQRPIRELYSYYHSRRKKMKYAEFREKGYFIGSGAVESANKYLVQARLKQAGMKWLVPGVEAVIMLGQKIYEKTWEDTWDARYANFSYS